MQSQTLAGKLFQLPRLEGYIASLSIGVGARKRRAKAVGALCSRSRLVVVLVVFLDQGVKQDSLELRSSPKAQST